MRRKRNVGIMKLLALIGILTAIFIFLLINDKEVSEPKPPPQPNMSYIEPHITGAYCDDSRPCPKGYECWSIHGEFTACVDPDPCFWYCGNYLCNITRSNPPQLECG